jgi:hypothetical protein
MIVTTSTYDYLNEKAVELWNILKIVNGLSDQAYSEPTAN